MDIFGIGAPELVFILIIALVVIGPKDLGKLGRQIGRFLNRLYRSESWRTLNEASRTLRTLPNRLAREAALEELDETAKELRHLSEEAKEVSSKSLDLAEGLRAWTSEGSSSSTSEGDQTSEKKTPQAKPEEGQRK
ncbi:MAG: twin-arginine translocase TatA/TatE family subunit [Anaerolineales bacterium]|jgi:sec-independent protein translocase protein TatB